MTTLRDIRCSRNQTITEVAKLTGIDIGNLSRIERGHQLPNKETISKLAKFYGDCVKEIVFNIYASE